MTDENQKLLRAKLVSEVEQIVSEDRATFELQFQTEMVRVAEENKWSKEKIDELKAMSPSEAFQTYGLGGGAGAVGIFALLRTFGKSRSKEEIERLMGEVHEVRAGQVAQAQAQAQSQAQGQQTTHILN